MEPISSSFDPSDLYSTEILDKSQGQLESPRHQVESQRAKVIASAAKNYILAAP